jgi:hypothetical protein
LASIERQPTTVLIFFVSKFAQRAPPWKEGGIEDQLFQNSPRCYVSLHKAPEEKASKMVKLFSIEFKK